MSILKFIKSYQNSEPKKYNKFFTNFEPILFKKVKAFSLKIKNQSSLFNYTDLHHDGRFALNMSKEGGGLGKFSKNEKKLKNNIENLIYKTFKKKKNIQDSYSSSLVSARYIINHFKKSSVFEIGPGTGYLGVILKKMDLIIHVLKLHSRISFIKILYLKKF